MACNKPPFQPSDHVLRTFAAVPVGNRVLDLGCGTGRHAYPLALLGFELYGCDGDRRSVESAQERIAEVIGPETARQRIRIAEPTTLDYPANFFDWILAYRVFERATSAEAFREMLVETRRVLKAGGWIYISSEAPEAGSTQTADVRSRLQHADTLTTTMLQAGFAVAEQPHVRVEAAESMLCAIYRKVEPGTPP